MRAFDPPQTAGDSPEYEPGGGRFRAQRPKSVRKSTESKGDGSSRFARHSGKALPAEDGIDARLDESLVEAEEAHRGRAGVEPQVSAVRVSSRSLRIGKAGLRWHPGRGVGLAHPQLPNTSGRERQRRARSRHSTRLARCQSGDLVALLPGTAVGQNQQRIAVRHRRSRCLQIGSGPRGCRRHACPRRRGSARSRRPRRRTPRPNAGLPAASGREGGASAT